jgi:hypothetical protein
MDMRTIIRAAIITAHCFFTLFTQNTYSMDQLPAISHKEEVAHVQYNAGISNGEQEFLKKRLPVVKASLEKMLQRPLQDNQVPKIAIIGSGGGYRAMLYFIATLYRAKKIGLLDATTYIAALSGSTWAVAPWISSGMSLKQFKNYLQECASKPFRDLTDEEKILITQAIKVKKQYNQPRTLVDLYGDFLANRLLACMGDSKQMSYLSEQAEKIKDGTYPYPIYTAIDGNENIIDNQTWSEYTPDTIGERTSNLFIPTWAYGRTFNNGKSTNNAPEKPLGYHMGTWGSAFGASIDDAREEITHMVVTESSHEKHQSFLKKLAEHVKGKRLLPFYAKVPNYLYGIETNDVTLSEKKHMKRVDAGLNMNLPYVPVSGICPERAPEILIFIDVSAGTIGVEFKKIENYARANKLPFPTINFDGIDKKTISIFKDKNNKAAPVVIYMPRISDEKLWEQHTSNPDFAHYNLSGFDLERETNHGFCETKHFQYAQKDSQRLMDQAEFNMHINEKKMRKAINWVIDRKS